MLVRKNLLLTTEEADVDRKVCPTPNINIFHQSLFTTLSAGGTATSQGFGSLKQITLVAYSSLQQIKDFILIKKYYSNSNQ